MLKDKNSSAIVAVSDIARAREFYEGKLGLEITDESMGDVLTFRTGATFLTAYVSEFAGTNRANAVTWDCGDEIDAIVSDLEARNVAFEHYPDIGRLEGNVHVAGEAKLVWLKDPDGNILHLLSM
ncbi:MAG: VOC family protein [Sphingosinicella sp.]|nr:VOC family protein [Sphingosinicella sp.]